MAKTKHTPGPWHTDAGQSFYVFAHGSLMEQAGVNNGPFVCNASTQANARLIAAAPELLASLRRVLKMLEIHDARLANFGEVEEARGIISRAEGAPYWGE